MRYLPLTLVPALLLTSVALAQNDPAFAVRGWLVHDPNLEYVKACLDRAEEFDINHIQLSHAIIHHGHEVLDDEGRREMVEAMAAYAREKGVKSYLWTHEMHEFPGDLKKDGKIPLDDQATWDWLHDKYNQVFDAVPSADGLILTFHETQASVYDDGRCSSEMSKPERVTKLITELNKVCEERGKELYVRTFVYRPDELDWVVEGIGNCPESVSVMSKCVPHDWQPLYPHNPAIGQFPDRTHIVEMDIAAEYYGQSILPFVHPEYIQMRLQYAQEKGLQGGVARIDRWSNHAFGTPNEINIVAWSRFLEDPDADVDKVWMDAVKQVYGEKRAKDIARILKRTWDITLKMYLTKDFYFINNHSKVPSLGYAEGHITSHSPAKWDPEKYKATEEELLNPTERTVREAVKEKEEAINLAERNVQELQKLERQIPDDVYEQLEEHLTQQYRATMVWRGLTEVFFWYKMHQKAPDNPLYKRHLASAMESLENTAAMVEQAVGPDRDYGSANRIRSFLNDIRKGMEKG